MKQLQVFNNSALGTSLQGMLYEGKPVFKAMAVAKSLGYKTPQKALFDHCKSLIKIKCSDMPHLGLEAIPQGITLLGEADLYRLIMRSDLPSAEAFQDWVVEEVLPAIRESGSYQSQFKLPETLPDALRLAADMAERVQELTHVVVEKDEKIDELGKLISDYEKQLAAGVSPPNFAKQLWGVHSNLVNAHLEKRGWLRKDARGNWRVNSMARDHYLTERIYDKDNGYGGYYTVYAHFLTKAGAVSIFKDYVNKKLPMRRGWDGTIGGGNVINLVNED